MNIKLLIPLTLETLFSGCLFDFHAGDLFETRPDDHENIGEASNPGEFWVTTTACDEELDTYYFALKASDEGLIWERSA